jgi:hypothetical protein
MTTNPKIFNIKTFNFKTFNIMTSNIEPLSREMAERICRRSGMPEADIPRWVDLHWPCAAAMLEAGVMDEGGEWVEDSDVRLGDGGLSRAVVASEMRPSRRFASDFPSDATVG